MKLILDTCALIWWTLDQNQLPCNTLETLNNNQLLVSSISIWEVGLKIKNNKLDIGMGVGDYVEQLKEVNNLRIVPIDECVWIKNLSLSWEHNDPADRTIVATAYLNDCYVVTTDKEIGSYYKRIFWD